MNLEDLKKLAQAATTGPWAKYGHEFGEPIVYADRNDEGGEHCIAAFFGGGLAFPDEDIEVQANQAYIAAANPAVVLELIAELETAKADIAVTNKLLEERQRVLDAIPECAPHGKCVPHALEWIEKAKHLSAIATSYITKLNLRAGDILCVKVAARHVPRYWIRSDGFQELKRILPDGVECLIYPDGADISKMEEAVIRKAGWVREPSDVVSLLAQLAEFKAAARTFVDRVHAGKIRSNSTYSTFAKLLGENHVDPAFFDIKLGEAYEPASPSSRHDIAAELAAAAQDMIDRQFLMPDKPTHFSGTGVKKIHKATDAELDELIEQVEARGKEVFLSGGQLAGRKTLLERIKAAVARHRNGGAQ